MATKANLVIDQGSTFSTDIYLKDENSFPIDLIGYTASSKIKKWYNSSNSVPFVTSINTNNGSITLSLDANTSGNMLFGRYVYDVEVVDTVSNTVSRIVEGIVTITPQVT